MSTGKDNESDDDDVQFLGFKSAKPNSKPLKRIGHLRIKSSVHLSRAEAEAAVGAVNLDLHHRAPLLGNSIHRKSGHVQQSQPSIFKKVDNNRVTSQVHQQHLRSSKEPPPVKICKLPLLVTPSTSSAMPRFKPLPPTLNPNTGPGMTRANKEKQFAPLVHKKGPQQQQPSSNSNSLRKRSNSLQVLSESNASTTVEVSSSAENTDQDKDKRETVSQAIEKDARLALTVRVLLHRIEDQEGLTSRQSKRVVADHNEQVGKDRTLLLDDDRIQNFQQKELEEKKSIKEVEDIEFLGFKPAKPNSKPLKRIGHLPIKFSAHQHLRPSKGPQQVKIHKFTLLVTPSTSSAMPRFKPLTPTLNLNTGPGMTRANKEKQFAPLVHKEGRRQQQPSSNSISLRKTKKDKNKVNQRQMLLFKIKKQAERKYKAKKM